MAELNGNALIIVVLDNRSSLGSLSITFINEAAVVPVVLLFRFRFRRVVVPVGIEDNTMVISHRLAFLINVVLFNPKALAIAFWVNRSSLDSRSIDLRNTSFASFIVMLSAINSSAVVVDDDVDIDIVDIAAAVVVYGGACCRL